MQNLNKELA